MYPFLEPLATLTGIISVWLNAKENIWGWVWGLVSVVVYAYIFWQAKLYADAGLQGVFAASAFYGIWVWGRGGVAKTLHPITRSTFKEVLLLALFVLAFTGGLGYYLATQTGDPRPWIDAALTGGSLVAQYQLARKRLENWLVWIAVDVVYVFLYLDQGLYYTSFLYFTYVIIAWWAYVAWKKAIAVVA